MGIVFNLEAVNFDDSDTLLELTFIGQMGTIVKAAKYSSQMYGDDDPGKSSRNKGGYAWLIKNGGYNKAYERIIDETDDLEKLLWLRKEFQVTPPVLKAVKERIEKCNKLGECKETKRWYKGIKKMYIDEGITPKMVEKAIEGNRKQIEHINSRIKEVRKMQKKINILKYERGDKSLSPL